MFSLAEQNKYIKFHSEHSKKKKKSPAEISDLIPYCEVLGAAARSHLTFSTSASRKLLDIFQGLKKKMLNKTLLEDRLTQSFCNPKAIKPHRFSGTKI